jgi:hypothetical protein
MKNEQQYWFPAKRYGWGWGVPVTWHGWVVLAIYGISLLLGAYFLHPHRNPGPFIVYVGVCSALFFIMCWLKGEPPRWRWGKD